LILPMSPLQTQQVMTSQCRSHIGPTMFNTDLLYYYYGHFVVEIDEKSSPNGGFNTT